MTKLITPLERELPEMIDRRIWIVQLHAWGIQFRAKRSQKRYDISWEAVWNRAMLIEAEAVKLAKKAAKKGGRKRA